MDKLFEKKIGRNVEVYMDEILVQSKRAEDHLKDLQETLESLSKVSLKLKAKKMCIQSNGRKIPQLHDNKRRYRQY